MNNVVLVGKLVRDPELKKTPQGSDTISFSVVVQRDFQNAEGNYDADFINCVAWNKTAVFISKYFSKGAWIGIKGNIRTRTYEKDGKKQYITEVFVDKVEFVGKKSEESNQTLKDEVDAFEPIDDPGLPF